MKILKIRGLLLAMLLLAAFAGLQTKRLDDLRKSLPCYMTEDAKSQLVDDVERSLMLHLGSWEVGENDQLILENKTMQYKVFSATAEYHPVLPELYKHDGQYTKLHYRDMEVALDCIQKDRLRKAYLAAKHTLALDE